MISDMDQVFPVLWERCEYCPHNFNGPNLEAVERKLEEHIAAAHPSKRIIPKPPRLKKNWRDWRNWQTGSTG